MQVQADTLAQHSPGSEPGRQPSARCAAGTTATCVARPAYRCTSAGANGMQRRAVDNLHVAQQACAALGQQAVAAIGSGGQPTAGDRQSVSGVRQEAPHGRTLLECCGACTHVHLRQTQSDTRGSLEAVQQVLAGLGVRRAGAAPEAVWVILQRAACWLARGCGAHTSMLNLNRGCLNRGCHARVVPVLRQKLWRSSSSVHPLWPECSLVHSSS